VAVAEGLDEEAVDRHADAVAATAGSIDVSFNLITHPYTHGIPFHEMDIDDFMAPVQPVRRRDRLTRLALARRGAEIRSCVRDPDGHLIEVGQTHPAVLEKLD
jgi:catechol 2,3-dioxygenase-like lactoylglutathione lyase family enzyme